jgi:hypothetical protein
MGTTPDFADCLAGLVAPGLLALGAQSRGLNDEGTITHVAIKKESIIAHHTDKYRYA